MTTGMYIALAVQDVSDEDRRGSMLHKQQLNHAHDRSCNLLFLQASHWASIVSFNVVRYFPDTV